jgi:chemotaxis protein MotB
VGDIRVMMVALNLILLVFFVYINSIATESVIKTKKALSSLMGTFSILPGGLQITPGKDLSAPGGPISIPGKSRTIFRKLIEEILREEKLPKDVEIINRGNDLVIHLSDDVLFPPGKGQLHSQAKQFLKKIGPVLKKSFWPLIIEGHTDNRPISTKEFPSNWELSAARATSVLRFFLEEYSITPERLTAVGYGEYQPFFPNDSSENRGKNRRVNIIIVGAGSANG